jgi:hypothetical protein
MRNHADEAFKEEHLAALYTIASMLAFSADFAAVGWICLVKAFLDTLSAIVRWAKSIKQDKDSTP